MLKRLVAILSLCILLSGCMTTDITRLHQDTTTASALKQTFYQVNIRSFDGTNLRATVYQPALAADEVAPLILHEHGFGVWRMNDPTFSIYGSLMVPGKAAKKAWKNGYWVISVDQRGFGGSNGNVHFLDPEIEIRDASAVIDWAITHLPKLKFDDTARKDPTIGMVGESYGGATQLLASVKDPRINAIVPMTTWYDLSESIAPNGQLKSFWTSVLVGIGTLSSFFDMGILTEQPARDSIAGKLSPEAQELLYQHSMAYFCDRGQYPHADTLLLQGFRDTIFPINEGWKNKECIERSGHDVRLISIQGGHILPTQKLTGLPFYNVENTFHCEGKSFNTIDTINNWFDAKLKGRTEAIAAIPSLCITQDYHSGIVTQTLQRGGEPFYIADTKVYPGLSGIVEWLFTPINWVQKSIARIHQKSETSLAQADEQGGLVRPGFLPLKIIHEDGLLTGIPTADFTITAPNKDPVIFVGIAIRHKNKPFELISEQVTPITKTGAHHIELVGISTRVKAGDVIGLVLYGANSQYSLNRTFIPEPAVVTGSLKLPLFRKENGNYVAYTPNSFTPDGQAVAQQITVRRDTLAARDASLSIQE